MIENILNLLEFAKSEDWDGDYIAVALGENKIPLSIKEALKQRRNEKR